MPDGKRDLFKPELYGRNGCIDLSQYTDPVSVLVKIPVPIRKIQHIPVGTDRFQGEHFSEILRKDPCPIPGFLM
jgi:hypothetical protein